MLDSFVESSKVDNINDNRLYRLFEKIEPEKSIFRIRSNKLIVTMHKWLETPWRELFRVK